MCTRTLVLGVIGARLVPIIALPARHEAAACRLLQTQQPEQLDAFRVMYEYNVDRAAALINLN